MCGIVGVVAAVGAPPIDAAPVLRATEVLAHRGPDGHSHWQSAIACLGHTRLSIIDLAGGQQPMPNEDGSVVTVYNGEIWNHASLRRELARAGHRFATNCDTEVLVHGYEEWGDSLLERLDGMFAFAIWDERAERLLLARDRVGKKPLYFSTWPGGLIFASDARAVCVAGGLEPRADDGAIPSFLFQRYVNAPRTLFRGISKLPPGELLSYDRVRPERRAYWRLTPVPAGPVHAREVRNLVDDAVHARLMSDVPIGVLLSGGIDSTAVAGLARNGQGSIATFTIGFDDPVYDERSVARETARLFRTEHHESTVSAAELLDALPRLAWYRDEPIAEASEIPLLLLAELAGRHVKVVLTGDGGDEVFGGYPKYRADRLLRLGGAAAALAFRGASAVAATRRSHRQLARAAETAGIRDPVTRWASWFRSFSPPELNRLLAPALRDSVASLVTPLHSLLEAYSRLDPGRQMLVGDFLTYLPDNMLVRSDKVLMAASVEGRMPLLDRRLVERVASSPAHDSVGLRTGKRILRDALADVVPQHVMRQPKRGFPVPVEHLLAADDRLTSLIVSERALSRGIFVPDEVRRLVVGEGVFGRDRRLKVFTLLSLELWLRTNVDSLRVRPPTSLDELVGD